MAECGAMVVDAAVVETAHWFLQRSSSIARTFGEVATLGPQLDAEQQHESPALAVAAEVKSNPATAQIQR